MRAVIETVFDIFYLVTVLTLGIRMIRGSKAGTQFRLFGLMAVVLGAGDSFHLVPRALALCTTGLENYAVPLGLGKWITSVTMTVFYVLLYYVWRKRYQIEGQKDLTIAVYALSAVRIVLCMMPQNQWLTNHTPLTWGILRSGWSAGSGSGSVTSSPAPAKQPACSAWVSASVSTKLPRPTLMRTLPCFICAMRFRDSSPRVSAVSGRQQMSVSAWGSSRSSCDRVVTVVKPGIISPALVRRTPMVAAPNTCSRWAVSRPIFPVPRMTTVCPSRTRSEPRSSQPPWRCCS